MDNPLILARAASRLRLYGHSLKLTHPFWGGKLSVRFGDQAGDELARGYWRFEGSLVKLDC